MGFRKKKLFKTSQIILIKKYIFPSRHITNAMFYKKVVFKKFNSLKIKPYINNN